MSAIEVDPDAAPIHGLRLDLRPIDERASPLAIEKTGEDRLRVVGHGLPLTQTPGNKSYAAIK